jgi:hypothetical protein
MNDCLEDKLMCHMRLGITHSVVGLTTTNTRTKQLLVFSLPYISFTQHIKAKLSFAERTVFQVIPVYRKLTTTTTTINHNHCNYGGQFTETFQYQGTLGLVAKLIYSLGYECFFLLESNNNLTVMEG